MMFKLVKSISIIFRSNLIGFKLMTYETQDTTELVKYFSNWYVFHESGIREAFPTRFAYHSTELCNIGQSSS